MRHAVASLVTVSLTMIVAVGPAAADEPAPGTPEWQQRDLDNMAYATERQQDMATNPAFGQVYGPTAAEVERENVEDRVAHPTRPTISLSRVLPGEASDPYRRHWDRGRTFPIEYLNGCGARIQGTIFGPAVGAPDPIEAGATLEPPYPGVVITTGSIDGYEEMYWWAAQGLAEAGYVVMTFDVMGQGESEDYCHDANGNPDPRQSGTGFTQGTVDALAFFHSASNPLLGELDTSRLGLAGHSAGAGAVSRLGQEDERVDAIVGWDNLSSLPASVTPRVPAMGQNAEYFFNPTPAFTAPALDGRRGAFLQLREAGIATMQIAHRGSTHLEWTFVPYILPASRDGERVAMYYTLAWFDRWVKGADEDDPETSWNDALAATDARRRLLAAYFDRSSDRSSIGAGGFEPLTQSNVPYKIRGEAVADHLSIYYRSSAAFDGFDCVDLKRDDCLLGEPPTLCERYCDLLEENCTGTNAQYENRTSCLEACAMMPADGTEGDQLGDTVQCRMYHGGAPSAAAPGTHCGHAGKSGGGVC